MMKKVLFITNVPVPYRMEFFRLLAKKVCLTVCFNDRCGQDTYNYDYNNEGFKCIFLSDFRKKNNVFKNLFREKYNFIIFCEITSPRVILRLLSLIRIKEKYGIEIDGALPKKDTFVRKIIKKIIIKHSSFFLSSGFGADSYFQKYGASKEMIIHYPFSSVNAKDCVMLSDFERSNKKKQMGFREDVPVLLFVGRFVERKGVDILLRAVSELERDFQLIVVGGMPNNRLLSLIANDVKNKIKFIDFSTKDVVSNYYKIADIFVFPTREDIWGLVINEAIARGCAVITTNRCGAGLELIKDGYNGFVVDINDYSELKNKILLLLNDNSLLNRFKFNCFELSKKNTIEKMVDIHLRFFNGGDSNETD